ncbi:ArnT family glycosyltransferase [Candidatus Oscillochloris fontis]|uniref:ArnT family glycosyltransferase n=1 Tax=Candidatus Oscillochloris fontis TaxID=2496868 RepID=UPI00101CC351|nr:hypothetical protein [Candidatus Oscillochloris fontis]
MRYRYKQTTKTFWGGLTYPDLLAIFGLLILYAITRFLGLERYPIYFFCDEAIQANLARELLDRDLRSYEGVLLPPYFYNAEKWSLSLSVYIQVISSALFGSRSIFTTRATSVVVSMLAILAVAMSLRVVFQTRFWWVGPLSLTIAPAWFVHSRTAFETVMMVAFYACFLCCYLLYRTRSSGWIFPSLIFGAATFYAYANGQGVMLVSGVLLLLVDLRYHLRQGWRLLSAASCSLILLAFPLVRFRQLEPEAMQNHLRVVDSYWLDRLPLQDKLLTFAQTYWLGLSPGYWFWPNDIDFERHRIPGLGHLPLILLPFFLVGLGVCIIRLRSPIYRVLLIAMLAAPFSSALASISIARVLAMLVPAAMLITLGMDQCYRWVARWVRYSMVAWTMALLMSLLALLLLRGALLAGPTWFTNYGLHGMQYGAAQVFGETIPEILARQPDVQLLVSSTWTNNPNALVSFFLNSQQAARVRLADVNAFLHDQQALDPQQQVFIMPFYEYDAAVASRKFVLEPPERIIRYPDGSPGFYVVRMRYVDNIEAILAAERIARAQLIETPMDLDGPVVVAHSQLDIGAPQAIFDGDPHTLMRGFEANPLVIELRFAQPRSFSGINLTITSMDLDLRLIAIPAAGGQPLVASQSYRNLVPDPTVSLSLPGGSHEVSSIRIEITQIGVGEVAHVHVREVQMLP